MFDRIDNASITVSVVSHKQAEMVSRLLGDLERCKDVAKIVVTQNVNEKVIDIPAGLRSRTIVLNNERPQGFGQNHNAAFRHCSTPFFCVLNPDIRLIQDPFPELLSQVVGTTTALVSPMIVDSNGNIEDSARRFPTPLGLVLRALGVDSGAHRTDQKQLFPDWVAGMFMLFKSADFMSIGGFDEKYFLYCEDTDICLTLRQMGKRVQLTSFARAIHDAQRTSRKNPRYMMWHIKSLFRLWAKHLGAARKSNRGNHPVN